MKKEMGLSESAQDLSSEWSRQYAFLTSPAHGDRNHRMSYRWQLYVHCIQKGEASLKNSPTI
jgi:hypothetical protein